MLQHQVQGPDTWTREPKYPAAQSMLACTVGRHMRKLVLTGWKSAGPKFLVHPYWAVNAPGSRAAALTAVGASNLLFQPLVLLIDKFFCAFLSKNGLLPNVIVALEPTLMPVPAVLLPAAVIAAPNPLNTFGNCVAKAIATDLSVLNGLSARSQRRAWQLRNQIAENFAQNFRQHDILLATWRPQDMTL